MTSEIISPPPSRPAPKFPGLYRHIVTGTVYLVFENGQDAVVVVPAPLYSGCLSPLGVFLKMKGREGWIQPRFHEYLGAPTTITFTP